MFIKKFNTFILIILILFTKKLYAEKMLIDNFNNDNQENWELFQIKLWEGFHLEVTKFLMKEIYLFKIDWFCKLRK